MAAAEQCNPYSHTSAMNTVRSNERGIAIVITLLVIVVLTIAATAFMQSMALERRTSLAYFRILKSQAAAQAGEDAALSKILSYDDGMWKRLSDFHFVIGMANPSDPLRKAPTLIKLNPNAATISATTELASRNSSGNGKTYTFDFNDQTEMRSVDLLPILDGSGTQVANYAFYVEPGTSKQSLADLTRIPRAHGLSTGELPIIKSDGVAISDQSSDALNTFVANTPSWKSLLLTPSSVNSIVESDAPITPKLNDWLAELHTWSASYNQLGSPKVNLRRLKYYVDTLARLQTVSNPRSLVVEALLDQSNQALQDQWGGGNLSWLINPSNPGKYTLLEARQIVANLLDYIDEDKIPITDNEDAPTYFGLESWKTSGTSGPSKVRGHPFINFVGTGAVFNRSSASSRMGALNSTRLLSTLGIVNPWEIESLAWGTSYQVEMSYEVEGDASGGKRGSKAQDYFLTNINDNIAVSPAPGGKIPGYSGYSFPQPTSGSQGYANFLSFISAPNGSSTDYQPPGMTFTDVKIKIKRLRLKFISSDGYTGYVQILDNLSTKPVPLSDAPIQMGSTGGALVIKYTGNPDKEDLHLNTDPRLNFNSSSWLLSKSREDSDKSRPPEPTPATDPFATMSFTDGDGLQGATPSHLWYTTSAISKHLYARSPDEIDSNPATTPYDPLSAAPQIAMESIADIGYLGTGKSWQTLRLYQTTTAKTSKSDWTLLDSLSTGTFPTRSQITLVPGLYSIDGLVNPNVAHEQTFRSLLQGIPNLPDPEVTLLLASLASPNPGNLPYISSGDLFADERIVWPSADGDFAKEELARRIANLLTTRSQIFTIHSYGETIQNNRVASRSRIKTVVELKPKTLGGPIGATILQREIENP